MSPEVALEIYLHIGCTLSLNMKGFECLTNIHTGEMLFLGLQHESSSRIKHQSEHSASG